MPSSDNGMPGDYVAPTVPLRRGLTVPVNGLALRELPELARRVEDLGYDDLWSEEATALDGITPLALAAATTRRLRLVTGVINPYTRGRAVLAQTAAALALASDGRFVLGLGASSKYLVESVNGLSLDSPASTMERTLEYVRAIFEGRRVEGGFRLPALPDKPIPIVLAALRGRMLSLAAERADGAFTNFLPISAVPRLVETRGARHCELACRVFSFLGDEDDALNRACRLFAAYGSSPYYADFYRWLGWSERVNPMVRAWEQGDRRAALELVPIDLVREIFLLGPVEAQLEQLARLQEAGIETAVLAFYGTPPQVDSAVSAFAPA
jgi:alkanesulfonate monooxygenase SsuD/methylene tetrahydromethanopterin reductase-like flavin-dependent oxidoreductase (luciferase family)